MTTTRAVVASLVGVAFAAGLGAAGYVAIANTTDGQVVGGGAAEVTFPATPTATMAVLDDAGNLASLAVLAVRPADDDEAGRGGTVVPVPISADSSGGFGTERTPLNETVALFGADTLGDEVPLLLGVGIDDVMVVDETSLADRLAPIGPIEVELPIAVTDETGRELAPAGRQTLGPDRLAAVLSASDPSVSGTDRYPIDVAVWNAIADAVGTGLTAPTSSSDEPASTVAAGSDRSDDVLGLVTSGPISVQPLRSSPIVSLDLNPRGVDAVALDRPEVLVILGHVAPSKVAAPNPGYNFRVVSSFADDQLPGGASRLDVAYTATEALLGLDANVISVDTSAGEAEVSTVIEVSDESLAAAADTLREVFGPVEVRVTDPRIAGVDVVATLGTSYLDRLDVTAASGSTAATIGSTAAIPGSLVETTS